jgi:ketosteroid isomerase-like protein
MDEQATGDVNEETLRMLREGYRALGFGAPEAVLRLFDQRVPGDEAGWTVRDVTSTTRYRPREVVADDLFGSIPPHWEVVGVEPMRFEGRGDRVIVMGHIKCRPRGGWDAMSVPFAHVWTVVRGKVVAVLSYLDGIEIERAAKGAA